MLEGRDSARAATGVLELQLNGGKLTLNTETHTPLFKYNREGVQCSKTARHECLSSRELTGLEERGFLEEVKELAMCQGR